MSPGLVGSQWFGIHTINLHVFDKRYPCFTSGLWWGRGSIKAFFCGDEAGGIRSFALGACVGDCHIEINEAASALLVVHFPKSRSATRQSAIGSRIRHALGFETIPFRGRKEL